MHLGVGGVLELLQVLPGGGHRIEHYAVGVGGDALLGVGKRGPRRPPRQPLRLRLRRVCQGVLGVLVLVLVPVQVRVRVHLGGPRAPPSEAFLPFGLLRAQQLECGGEALLALLKAVQQLRTREGKRKLSLRGGARSLGGKH
eukprot:3778502-Pyramimonas_sp.AAC.1